MRVELSLSTADHFSHYYAIAVRLVGHNDQADLSQQQHTGASSGRRLSISSLVAVKPMRSIKTNLTSCD